MQAEPAILRPLGFGEARMYYQHKLLGGTTQGAAAVRLVGELAPERLRAALERVQAQHQILNVVIVEREGVPCFAEPRVPRPIPLRVLSRLDDEAWLSLLESRNAQALDPLGLVELVLLYGGPGAAQRHDLLLFVHHSIIDGLGAERLVEALLAEAAREQPAARERRPLPPEGERVVPRTMTWLEYVRHQQDAVGALRGLALFPHRHVAAVEERRTRVRTLQLASESVKQLHALCARRGVTLNSYVSACLLQAVRAQTPERSRFALHTAFSTRRLCSEALEDDDLGCYLAVVPTVHELGPGADLHALASEYQKALTRAVLEHVRFPREVDYPSLAGSISALREARHFVHDLGYTYTEGIISRRHGDLEVAHFYQTVNRAAGNAALVVHGMRFCDALYFTINYPLPLQDEPWVERVIAGFAECLVALSATLEGAEERLAWGAA